MRYGDCMPGIPGVKSIGLLFVLAVGLLGCATPSGLNDPRKDEFSAAPGISIETVFRTATAAGDQMRYTATREGNRLVMTKRLPVGTSYFGGNPAGHQNRIIVSATSGADSAPPVVRVEGEYLGNPLDSDLHNCVSCDVNKIKKAIREAR